jgi:hypothetical protein
VKYRGKKWIQAGKLFLDLCLKEAAQYGPRKPFCPCGAGAKLGLAQLAEAMGNIQLRPGKSSFGLDVTEFVHPSITLRLYDHPEFNVDPNLDWAIAMLDEEAMEYIYLKDTYIRKDIMYDKGGETGQDGKKESWFTDGGIAYHSPQDITIMYGIGLDNTAA